MDAAEAGAHLVCRMGVLCALPIASVSETMRPLPIKPLAGTPEFVLGLAIVRASPIPVLDARVLVGGTPAAPTRFVAIRTGARMAALAVDSVLGVRALTHAATESVPPLLTASSAELIAAVGVLDADLLLVLRTAYLFPESLWSSLDMARDRA